MHNILRPVEIGHFVIRSREIEPLVSYYKLFFGATLASASQTPSMAFLTYDDEHHRLALIQDASAAPKPTGPAAPPTCGFDHVAFTVPGLGDLLRSYRARRDAGLRPASCWDHGFSVSMYYLDPDGNKLELQTDVFADPADAARFMATDVFAANPVGVSYNPDELLQRLEAGESENQLLMGMLGRTTLGGLAN